MLRSDWEWRRFRPTSQPAGCLHATCTHVAGLSAPALDRNPAVFTSHRPINLELNGVSFEHTAAHMRIRSEIYDLDTLISTTYSLHDSRIIVNGLNRLRHSQAIRSWSVFTPLSRNMNTFMVLDCKVIAPVFPGWFRTCYIASHYNKFVSRNSRDLHINYEAGKL